MDLGRSILMVVGVAGLHGHALACSVVVPEGYDGSAKQFRDVRDEITESSAIIDGQVIRPYIEGKQNALVLAYHVLKGPKQNVFEVGRGDSCTIVLDHVGERARMILNGGPAVYLLYADQSEARIEDRILGTDRRKVWPYFNGRPAGTSK
jgi:hypothetical protein